MMTEKRNVNCAYYQEVCILRLLAQMGYLDEKVFQSIVQIAAEDSGATLILNQNTLCLNC